MPLAQRPAAAAPPPLFLNLLLLLLRSRSIGSPQGRRGARFQLGRAGTRSRGRRGRSCRRRCFFLPPTAPGVLEDFTTPGTTHATGPALGAGTRRGARRLAGTRGAGRGAAVPAGMGDLSRVARGGPAGRRRGRRRRRRHPRRRLGASIPAGPRAPTPYPARVGPAATVGARGSGRLEKKEPDTLRARFWCLR